MGRGKDLTPGRKAAVCIHLAAALGSSSRMPHGEVQRVAKLMAISTRKAHSLLQEIRGILAAGGAAELTLGSNRTGEGKGRPTVMEGEVLQRVLEVPVSKRSSCGMWAELAQVDKKTLTRWADDNKVRRYRMTTRSLRS